MLAVAQTFLSSPNAIVAACIGSWGVTSISVEDMMHRPIQSVFWPLVFGTVAGSWISDFTPPGFGPYVASGIIGITLTGLIAKRLGLGPKIKSTDKHWSLTLLESINGENERILPSYTTHILFKGQGIVLETENVLTPEVVENVLTDSLDCLDEVVVSRIGKITSYLIKADLLDKVSGVFIHDKEKGYVMINGPKQEHEHILSLLINK